MFQKGPEINGLVVMSLGSVPSTSKKTKDQNGEFLLLKTPNMLVINLNLGFGQKKCALLIP